MILAWTSPFNVTMLMYHIVLSDTENSFFIKKHNNAIALSDNINVSRKYK